MTRILDFGEHFENQRQFTACFNIKNISDFKSIWSRISYRNQENEKNTKGGYTW
jgi:hypothetical protein